MSDRPVNHFKGGSCISLDEGDHIQKGEKGTKAKWIFMDRKEDKGEESAQHWRENAKD